MLSSYLLIQTLHHWVNVSAFTYQQEICEYRHGEAVSSPVFLTLWREINECLLLSPITTIDFWKKFGCQRKRQLCKVIRVGRPYHDVHSQGTVLPQYCYHVTYILEISNRYENKLASSHKKIVQINLFKIDGLCGKCHLTIRAFWVSGNDAFIAKLRLILECSSDKDLMRLA